MTDHSIDIDDLTAILVQAGYRVEWPVTGKLLLDGHEMDVDDILIQAEDAYQAAEQIMDAGVQ